MKLLDKVKNKAKNKIKNIIMSVLIPIIIKFVALLLISLSVVLLLASFWYIIKGDTVKQTSDVIRNDGSKPPVTVKPDLREYDLDTEFSKEVTQALKKLSIDPEAIGLSEELITKMYKAEIFTSYPDLRKRDKIGTKITGKALQGCVQFNRKYGDGTENILEYMDFSTFQKKLAELGCSLPDENGKTSSQKQIYTTQEDIQKNYNDLKNYFTLDSEYNLIVATIDTKTTSTSYSEYAMAEGNAFASEYTYTVSYKKINYQSQVEKYSMPFEFPLCILAITENPGFCEAIIDLVNESKIVIEVQDNLTTTTTVENYDYDAYFKIYKKVNYTVDVEVEEPEKEGETKKIQRNSTSGVTAKDQHLKLKDIENTPFSKETTVTTENNINLCIVKANTWLLDTEAIYAKNETVENTTGSVTIEDDQEYKRVSDYHGFLANFSMTLQPGAYDITMDINESYIEEKKLNKEKKIYTTTQTITYAKTSSTIEQKEEKFLSLLAVNPKTGEFDKENRNNNTKLIKYEDVYGTKCSPEDKILSSEQMLFEFLSYNETSQSFEEIMRYLLYVYTGQSYGVTILDFSIYEAGEFKPISSGGIIVGGSIQEKVWFALKNLGFSDYVVAGAMGNIDYESGGFSATAVEGGTGNGIGLIQWSFGRRVQLEAYAKSKGVTWKDEDTQIEFLIAEISGQGPASNYATRRTAGYIKEEGKENTAYYSDWANATTINDATLAFMRFFESPKSAKSYSERCKRSQKYYDQFKGKTSVGNAGELGEKAKIIIEWAEKQIGKSQFYNKHNGKLEISKGRCAAFAKSAYYEAGLGYTYGNAIDIPHPNAIKYDASGKVDCSSIPIGAFIVSRGTSSYGHVALYVGNGYVIEAGGKTIVKQKIDSSYGKGNFLGWGC